MTYDELVTNIRNYTEVNANVFTNAVINTFITMAENQILREIDLDVFKVEATANMTSGNKFLSAPSDILTHRYMMITSGNNQIFLDFRDTSFMKEYAPNGSATGTPKRSGSFALRLLDSGLQLHQGPGQHAPVLHEFVSPSDPGPGHRAAGTPPTRRVPRWYDSLAA